MTSTWDKMRLLLSGRRTAYIQLFNGPNADVVLRDLARFCRAHESTFADDPRLHALAEGRREVWLRIQNHLQMTPTQLWNLYSGMTAPAED